MTHAKSTAVLWGSEGQPISIGHGPPMWRNDSGFSIVLDDSPDPSEVEPGDPGLGLICLICVIDDFPGIGVGLEIARQFGVADIDENGEWIAGDLSRLNSDASRNSG